MTLVWSEGQGNWEPLKDTKVGKIILDSENECLDYDIDQDVEQDDEIFNIDSAAEEVQKSENLFNDLADGQIMSSQISEAETLTITDISSVPAVMKGILLKMASGLVKNWRNRYFIMNQGVMSYFEPVHLIVRGRYHLEGLQIVDDHLTDSPETIRLYSPTKPDIVLIASSVNPTSPEPFIAARNGPSPRSMCRVMFSKTTIASSTTSPAATISAMSDRLFSEKP